MHLLNAYCCHFYGFNDKNIKYIITAWNRAVRKIWNLPYDSHRTLICALNNGSNALDFIYTRFCKMYKSIANSENTKLSMFIKMCKNDKRMILSRNLRCVCKNRVCQSYNYETNGNLKKCMFLVKIIMKNVNM